MVTVAAAGPPEKAVAYLLAGLTGSGKTTYAKRLDERDQCIDTHLAAERQAAEEIHARPAIRALVSGLLVSGTTTELSP